MVDIALQSRIHFTYRSLYLPLLTAVSNSRHFSVNACLMPVLATDGCHVTTVEGIGTLRDTLHPVQRAMVDLHGSQCGKRYPQPIAYRSFC